MNGFRADSDLDERVRHMLRALHDPAALRANPLARVLAFPGDEKHFVATLRALVLAALPARSRAAQIVELCDIEGLPHKVVASRLCISLRHFYRERSHARELVRDAIGARLYVGVEHDRCDVLADELEAHHEALDRGHSEDVLERTGTLLEDGVPPSLLANVRALRARALAESGAFEAADDELRRTPERTNASAAATPETEFARGCMLLAGGRHADAAPHAQRACMLDVPAERASDRDRRAHARHLTLVGHVRQEHQDSLGAVIAFESARDVLDACRVAPQTQLVRVALDLAVSRLVIPDMADHGTAEAVAAYRAVAWHGLSAEREWAAIVLALAALTGTNVHASLGRIRPPADVTSGAGHWLGRMRLLLARVQTANGEPRRALRSTEAARGVLPPGHYLHGIADLRTAEALNALDDARAALPLAADAIDRVSFGSWSHYTGSAHVATADALNRLGNTALAIEHCEAGLTRLRAGALVHDLSRALRFAARLTGDPRYAREERELLAG